MVSRGQVPSLQDMDDQVSEVSVVVDLELEKKERRLCEEDHWQLATHLYYCS